MATLKNHLNQILDLRSIYFKIQRWIDLLPLMRAPRSYKQSRPLHSILYFPPIHLFLSFSFLFSFDQETMYLALNKSTSNQIAFPHRGPKTKRYQHEISSFPRPSELPRLNGPTAVRGTAARAKITRACSPFPRRLFTMKFIFNRAKHWPFHWEFTLQVPIVSLTVKEKRCQFLRRLLEAARIMEETKEPDSSVRWDAEVGLGSRKTLGYERLQRCNRSHG